MDIPKPTDQHSWLRKLLGTWHYEQPGYSADGLPAGTLHGTETFRAIGDLWVQGEATGPMGDGTPSTSIMTLGFDPAKGRFVGTWFGTMMTTLWVYDGELDANGRALRLYAEGPAFDGSGAPQTYMDVVELVSDDHRTLTGHAKDANGEWKPFMTAHYRRA